MGVYVAEQVKDIIQNNPNAGIVKKAQDMRKLYSRHTHSIGYKDSLKRDSYVEDVACYSSRKDSAISNRDLFQRVLNEESQIFTTVGGSAFFGLPDNEEKQMTAIISDVINGMSLYKWVETYALPAYRADPMGIIFMEIEEVNSVDGTNFNTPRCYPTYKSSDEIHDYEPNGRNLEYICFKLTPDQLKAYGLMESGNSSEIMQFATGTSSNQGFYRFIDDATDTVYKLDGGNLTIVALRQQNPIRHDFGKVPAFIISDLFQYDDPRAFGSPLQFVIEIAEAFANDRSVMYLHKKLHGFPKAVEPLLSCTTCSEGGVSTGLKGGNPCPDCTIPGHSRGTGYKLKTTPADVARFPLEMLKDIPRFKASDIFMYITPDVEGLTLMNQLLINQEELIYSTYWGTKPNIIIKNNGKKDTERTATETMTNLQPKYARLNTTADFAENTMNAIANFIGKFCFKESWKQRQSSIKLSRDYILELPETLLEVYHDMIKKYTPEEQLDTQYRRYLQARFKGNGQKLAIAIKGYELQPFPNKPDEKVQGDPNISQEDKVANSYFAEWWRNMPEVKKQMMNKQALQADFKEFAKNKLLLVKSEAQELLQQEAATKLN